MVCFNPLDTLRSDGRYISSPTYMIDIVSSSAEASQPPATRSRYRWLKPDFSSPSSVMPAIDGAAVAR